MLNWVDQMAAEQPLDEAQMAEQIRDLAHGENVEEWSRAIAQYLSTQTVESVCMTQLKQALPISLIEIWLGLLLGGFRLHSSSLEKENRRQASQQSKHCPDWFYYSEVWVSCS